MSSYPPLSGALRSTRAALFVAFHHPGTCGSHWALARVEETRVLDIHEHPRYNSIYETDSTSQTATDPRTSCDAACHDGAHQCSLQLHHQVAWQTRTFGKFALQKLCYADVREQFGLSAQVTVRALAKVGDAYKLDKKAQRAFRPLAAIAYDDRILSYNLHKSSVSIWTVEGRQTLPFVCGERQRVLLQSRLGESDLVERAGEWYLLATCDLPNPEPEDVDDALGVDLGVSNIATDSDGAMYSGSTIKNVRYRHRRLRSKLQKKGTLSAKRRLRKLSGQEARFARDTNHTISKRLVSVAKRTKRALALEDLKGIRTRLRGSTATAHDTP
jgi:putative transposase